MKLQKTKLVLTKILQKLVHFTFVSSNGFWGYGWMWQTFCLVSRTGERKSINSELWHACAGPLVSLPPVGSLVVYFPQGHSEQVCRLSSDLKGIIAWYWFLNEFLYCKILQVAASMQKETDFIPNYPNLPSKLICMLHNLTLHVRELRTAFYKILEN